MASPAEIVQALPDTLPEDFSEWDSGHPSAAPPVNSHNVEPVPDAGPAPAVVPPKPPATFARSQVKVMPVADGHRSAPSLTPASAYSTHEALPWRTQPEPVEEEEPKSSFSLKDRKAAIIAGAASVVLLLVLIPLLYPRFVSRAGMVKQAAAQQDASTGTDVRESVLKPSPATPLSKSALAATATNKPTQTTQQATDADPTAATGATTTDTAQNNPQQVQSTMMNDQLAAPTRIPQDIKNVPQPDAPPAAGFGPAGEEGLGSGNSSAMGSVFAGSNKTPKVKPEVPTKVSISSGVASGLLLQRTVPSYPQIAKAAHVSGTVVLQATISKAGTISKVRVITGPAMLQQSAMDAVKSWRYRPYKLDGNAVEVETTVNVVFSISGQ